MDLKYYLDEKVESVNFTIGHYELGLMQNVVYLIHDHASNRAALVDPAWDVPTLVKYVNNSGARLTDILITHCHDDHSNGIRGLLSYFPSVAVHYTIQEAAIWDNVPQQGYAHRDGAVIELGDSSIEVLHTPGHSPGSACFRLDDRLFTGDTMFVYGCGRCDLSGGDPRQLYDSLRRIVTELPSDTIIYPGHHYAIPLTSTLEEQRRGNPFLHFKQREALIMFRHVHSHYRQPPYEPLPRRIS